MNQSIYSLFLIFASMLLHDVQVANFKIHKKADQLIVDFEFEREDILNCLENTKDNISSTELQKYILSHFTLQINELPVELSFDKFKIKTKHIKIQGSSPYPKDKIENIEIHNTILLSIPEHSNIIEIRLNDQERDFLMNQKRPSINLTL